MRSVFDGLGFQQVIDRVVALVVALYLEDPIPWVVGYSGGKDSTAVLSIVWLALRSIPPDRRKKTVHVISTDTLVENPVIASWANNSLMQMRVAAAEQQLPIEAHRLTPEVHDSFWVMLIGKGYAAPRPKFRWCTDRLKIRLSNKFITDVISKYRETILILGTRKAESAARAKVMARLETERIRDGLSPNASLPGSLVFSPIEDWTSDDVWLFLMQVKNPWGWSNKDLLGLYQGASPDGECPLVVDTTTPSCGNSRFGCYVCTMVQKDSSMQAMIANSEQHEWMLPLLELRNALDLDDDRHLRDFRRMDGRVDLMGQGDSIRVIPGPYTQASRIKWLRMLLEAQSQVHASGPELVRNIDLVSHAELEEIRRIWVMEKAEFEDVLPDIYEGATGQPYPTPGGYLEVCNGLGSSVELLRECCEGDETLFDACRHSMLIDWEMRSKVRRAGIYDAVAKGVARGTFMDADEAIAALRPGYEARIRQRELAQVPKNEAHDGAAASAKQRTGRRQLQLLSIHVETAALDGAPDALRNAET
jgi:DNA sulfur modification protein DndC